MTMTVFPSSTSRCSALRSNSMSAICRPMVGSSSKYNVDPGFRIFGSARRLAAHTPFNCVTSLSRCASPPLKVGLVDQASDTQGRYRRGVKVGGRFSDALKRNAQLLDRHFHHVANHVRYREPAASARCTASRGNLHTRHNCWAEIISSLIAPWPLHVSQRPPSALNENRLAEYPRIRDTGNCA